MTVARSISKAVSRRSLVSGSLAGGFLLAFHLPVRAFNEPVQPPDDTAGKFAPNAFIRIDRSGKTTLVMPQVEMGQGVYTSIPMILAEELDADFSQVMLEHAPPSDKLYGNPLFGIQATGNSNWVGRGGSRCAPPAPARAPCWFRPPRSNGRLTRQAARPPIARSCTRRAGESFPMARWWMPRTPRRRQRMSH